MTALTNILAQFFGLLGHGYFFPALMVLGLFTKHRKDILRLVPPDLYHSLLELCPQAVFPETTACMDEFVKLCLSKRTHAKCHGILGLGLPTYKRIPSRAETTANCISWNWVANDPPGLPRYC